MASVFCNLKLIFPRGIDFGNLLSMLNEFPFREFISAACQKVQLWYFAFLVENKFSF